MRKRYRRYSTWSPRWKWKARDTVWLEAWELEVSERWWEDEVPDEDERSGEELTLPGGGLMEPRRRPSSFSSLRRDSPCEANCT
jgi:hypothetical protein